MRHYNTMKIFELICSIIVLLLILVAIFVPFPINWIIVGCFLGAAVIGGAVCALAAHFIGSRNEKEFSKYLKEGRNAEDTAQSLKSKNVNEKPVVYGADNQNKEVIESQKKLRELNLLKITKAESKSEIDQSVVASIEKLKQCEFNSAAK